MNRIEKFLFDPMKIKNRFFKIETCTIENFFYIWGIWMGLDLMLQGGFFVALIPLILTLGARFMFNTFRRWDREIFDEPDYHKSASRLEWEREVVDKRVKL